jgi:hypothetical protein
MARFVIDGKTYTTTALDEVPLKDLIRFNTEAADMGLRERWNDVQRAAVEMDGMTETEAEDHPDSLLVMAVTIWVSRRLAGEDLAFGDAVDVPMNHIKFLADPGDRKGPTKGAAKKARPKTPARASAVVVGPLEPLVAPTTPPTSETESSTE